MLILEHLELGLALLGMDLIELHCVKWPTDYLTGGSIILLDSIKADDVNSTNNNIDFIVINPNDTANTKIGTARIRQLDFRAGEVALLMFIF